MTFNHAGTDKAKELLTSLFDSNSQENILDQDTTKEFYSNRLDILNKQVDELEAKKNQIEKEIRLEIRHILATKGAELVSIKQLQEVILKESGACELRLSEINEKQK